MKNIKIEKLRNKEDLRILANIYLFIYNNSVLQEKWTLESATKLLEYFYNLCPDLFYVAYHDNQPVGAIMSGLKPWWDGMHLEDTEIFVAANYQGKGIGTELYKTHYKMAIEKYGATIMEAHTYSNENGYPLEWYKNLGFEIVDDWKIISGNIKKVLKKLSEEK